MTEPTLGEMAEACEQAAANFGLLTRDVFLAAARTLRENPPEDALLHKITIALRPHELEMGSYVRELLELCRNRIAADAHQLAIWQQSYKDCADSRDNLCDELEAKLAAAEARAQALEAALREIYADICMNRDDASCTEAEFDSFSQDIAIVLNVARRVAGIELDAALAQPEPEGKVGYLGDVNGPGCDPDVQ